MGCRKLSYYKTPKTPLRVVHGEPQKGVLLAYRIELNDENVVQGWSTPDPAMQFSNPYLGMGNNPVMYVDPNGESIVLAMLIYGAVNTGIDLMMNSDMNIGEIGTSFAVGAFQGLLAGPAASAYGTFFTAASQKVSSIMPSANIPLDQNTSISIGAGIGSGPQGLVASGNVSLNYRNDNFSLSLGAGGGTNGTSWGAGIQSGHWGYYYSVVGGGTSNAQAVGGFTFDDGTFSMRFENDMFAWQGKDRFRSGGVEFGYNDFVLGTQVYTDDPEGDEVDLNGTNLNGKLNRPARVPRIGKKRGMERFGAHLKSKVHDSPLYVGYSSGGHVYRYGVNHPRIQDGTQNVIHRYFPFGRTDFFNKYSDYSGGYFSSSPINPFSIYYY
jgi:hypothetical protein